MRAYLALAMCLAACSGGSKTAKPSGPSQEHAVAPITDTGPVWIVVTPANANGTGIPPGYLMTMGGKRVGRVMVWARKDQLSDPQVTQ